MGQSTSRPDEIRKLLNDIPLAAQHSGSQAVLIEKIRRGSEDDSDSENEDKSLSPSTSDSPRKSGTSQSSVGGPEHDQSSSKRGESSETSLTIALQVVFPFLIAGFGMVGAGMVLDKVQHWMVFKEINELFILVPALLGLKGNLEMTLASRLSTLANLGQMDDRSDCIKLVTSNLALIQLQGIVVGFIASVFAMVMDFIPEGSFSVDHGLLLVASAVITASIASFVLGLVMVFVIICSRQYRINPDNVATPIAASLGDLVTLGLLSSFASILYADRLQDRWLAPVIITVYVLFTPFCFYLARKTPSTAKVLYTGWTPVLVAMTISSAGGLILDNAVAKFKGIAVFQPVFNGVGGNLVAVQASRISTYLHSNAEFGILPHGDEKVCIDPCTAIFGQSTHSRTARILLLIVLPGHLIFALMITFLKSGQASSTPIFFVLYLLAAVVQIWILLHTAHWLIHLMWKRSIDPDNSAIPYLTALGDLLGGGLLALAFEILVAIKGPEPDLDHFLTDP